MSMVKPLGAQDAVLQRPTVRWLPHVAFVVTAVVFVGVYTNTIKSLISIWASTGRYQYAFLIFPVSAVLAWLRRDDLKRLAARPTLLGLVPLVFLCLIWLVGAAARINVVTQFSIVAMVPCLVFTLYGTVITRALMFPLAYLVFAIPFGNFLVVPLQTVTARLSVAALQWTPIPVFLDRHYIMTPSSTWHVAEACSGVSFLFATTAFGVLYAYLFFRSWRRRLLFVALALITPIVANGLRVFFTILIGEYFGMQYATGTDHMVFGWQFFGTVLVLLFLVGWPWHEPEQGATIKPPPASHHRVPGSATTLWVTACTIILLAAAPTWLAVGTATATPVTIESPKFPQIIGAMHIAATTTTNVSMAPGTVYHNPPVGAQVRYVNAPYVVNITTASYPGISDSASKLVTYGNQLFDSTVWHVAESQDAPVAAFHALTLVRKSGEGGWLLWYFYRVGDRTVTSTKAVKLWRAWDRILGRTGQTQVVTLSTSIEGNRDEATQRLEMVAGGLPDMLLPKTIKVSR